MRGGEVARGRNMSEIEKKEINDYLTEEERKKLLASLHHVLVWVGVREPEELQIDGNDFVERDGKVPSD